MANRRVFYAIYAAGLAPNGTNSFTGIHGLQSIGLNTRFSLEQVFEIGQLAIYQQVEANVPDIETTLEKVLDGNALLYHLATYGAPDGTLVGRSNQRTTLGLSIFGDTQSSASGTPIQQVTCSGMYLQSLTYDIRLEGNATESVTLVGNNKTISAAVSGVFTFTGGYLNTDVPLAPEGVNRRQMLNTTLSLFPKVIPGINQGTGKLDLQTDGSFSVHFQSIRITANLGRDQLHELGHKQPYFRFVNFPVEIRTDFEVLNTVSDGMQGTEAGVLGNGNNIGAGDRIFIQMTEGTKIDLGTQNVISAANFGGANAGARGGNARTTYSFITFNTFLVVHPQDPTPGLAG